MTALRSAQDFSALDVAARQVTELERSVHARGGGHVGAVDQNLDVVAVRSAHEHKGRSARAEGLHNVETRAIASA